MAKVEFIPGIANISGTLNKKSNKRVVFTHRQSDPRGIGRVYLRRADSYQRRTPFSPTELAAHERFGVCAQVTALLYKDKAFCKKHLLRTRKDIYAAAKTAYDLAVERGYTPVKPEWLAERVRAALNVQNS